MERRIALFMDVENFYISSRNLGLQVSITPIIERLKEYGRLDIRRSFGDLEKVIFHYPERNEFRKDLYRNLFLHEDSVYIADKNHADIRMVIETMAVAYERPEINTFAIVSSDRDFLPCVVKLRELGKEVIGVGVSPTFTNKIFPQAYDIFFYYESLTMDEGALEVQGAQAEAMVIEDASEGNALVSEYFWLLRKACALLDDFGSRLSGAAISNKMRQLRSDFDPRLVGCPQFKDFIRMAADHGVVQVTFPDGPGDILVTEVSSKPIEAPRSLPIFPPRSDPRLPKDPRKIADVYRSILEKKLKFPVLPREKREALLDAIAAAYPRSDDQPPIHLDE